MRISLNWLTDYVDVSMNVNDLAELFTTTGLNCEEIIETATDIVLDLEVTSNRGDCLGHLGVARELAAATGAEFRPPQITTPATDGNAADLTSVEVLAPDLCPRYTARVIRGVKIGPSPAWLVERLEAAGLRSVNNVVDVTNFVLMEYAQPLHSFDYDKLAEGRIVVRRGIEGETLVSIDETTCRLDESMLVIADAASPVAIAGIMGGLNTEVTATTTNLLIESAQFDQLTTRHTSRKLGLMSESNYRFERGVDPVGLEQASLRACAMIVELAGGKMAEGLIDVWAEPFQAPQVKLRTKRCNDLLGLDTPPERQREILDTLGLSATLDDSKGEITCTIPPFRSDLTREADLIEEVARIVGYDNIPVASHVTHTVTDEGHTQQVRRKITSLLAAAGFDEAVTFSFTDVEQAALFGYPQPICVDSNVRKTNNALRPTLLGSLLKACKVNQDAGNARVNLFELAGIFPPPTPTASADGAGLPDESVELALISNGELRVLRGAIETLLARLAPGSNPVEVRPADMPGFTKGQAAEILFNGQCVGSLGCISDKVLDYYDIEQAIAAARISFSALAELSQQPRAYKPVAKFPPVERDLSVIVDEGVTWQEVNDAIGAVAQPLRTNLEYVTTYRGKQIPAGRKSVTARLTYRSAEGTLRGEDVDALVAEVVAALNQELSAALRT